MLAYRLFRFRCQWTVECYDISSPEKVIFSDILDTELLFVIRIEPAALMIEDVHIECFETDSYFVSNLAEAEKLRADRIICPANHHAPSPNSPANSPAPHTDNLAEQFQLCRDLATVAGQALPPIDTPLLALNDAQVIQLGDRLNVPWHAAWSCDGKRDEPCQACQPCRRRNAAFLAANLLDTQTTAIAAR